MKQKKPFNHQSNLRIFAANNCHDPLAQIDEQFRVFRGPNDEVVNVSCVTSQKLPAHTFSWISKLTEDNMKTFYEQTENGWNLKQKEKEFKAETARFLLCELVDAEQTKLVAFVHFRFEMDDEDKHPVIYCYEIQVVPEFQSKGLGKQMMQILYEIGQKFKMFKVMLTCFHHNQKTLDFYNRLGYTSDVCSPSRFGQDASYEIMSKKIRQDNQ